MTLDWLNDPRLMVRVHFWAAIAWMVPMTAAAWVIVYKLPDPHAAFAILLVSNYANFVSHWSAWQAVRAEIADIESDEARV